MVSARSNLPLFAGGVVALVALFYLVRYLIVRFRALRITAIHVYPVKSCGALSLTTCPLNRLGLQYDRNWMIVDATTGVMLTAREVPHMSLIQPRFEPSFEAATHLVLTFPGMEELKISIDATKLDKERDVMVWEHTRLGQVYDDAVNDWVTRAIAAHPDSSSFSAESATKKTKYQLVAIRDPTTFQAPLSEKFDWNPSEMGIHGSFADGYPLLLTSESSLTVVNSHTQPKRTMEMKAFRPNLVINGNEPWAEDTWRQIEVTSQDNDSMKFWVAKPCERCIQTTVVPSLGRRHESGEPLVSLRKFRKMLPHMPRFKDSVFFGQNLIQQTGNGRITVGDRVRVVEMKPKSSPVFEFAPAFVEAVRKDPKVREEAEKEFGGL